MVDFKKVLDASQEANKADGVALKGKKYTTVAIRVDLFRRHFGAWGVQTEIVSMGNANGEAVVMLCRISDETGRIVATGHAHEIIGRGNVNTTSALENAETSAIGRALAVLGVHGGEFASANELDGAERNGAVIKAAVIEGAAAKEESERKKAEQHETNCERAKTFMRAMDEIDELVSYWSELNKTQFTVASDPDVINVKDEVKAAIMAKQKEAAA